MRWPDRSHMLALALSVALHVVAILGLSHALLRKPPTAEPPAEAVVFIDLPSPPREVPPPLPPTQLPPSSAEPLPRAAEPQLSAALPDPAMPMPTDDRPRAYQDAPPPPSAEEWALAATYQLKNSKRYRYTWGQQVRSMMGTAFEGADQGLVRFRVEIAPDGSLVSVVTLWSTSDKAEQLARQAIQNMPPLPPTPTGKPLVFEKTISFQPGASDEPPVYKDDCLPDPPAYRNPFAWDGKSPQVRAAPTGERAAPLDEQAMAECLKQLPPDSVEAEAANDQRHMERWGWGQRR